MGKPTTVEEQFDYTTYDPEFHTPRMSLALAVVGFPLAAITVFGNFLLLLTIYRNPRGALRTPPTFLIANLGVADLLVGLLIGNLVAARDVFRFLGKPVPKAVDKTVFISLALTLFVSIYTILCMSVDRYLAVSSPLTYRLRVTLPVVRRWLLVIWISSLIICWLPITDYVPFKKAVLVYANIHASLPIVFLTILYGMIFSALARRKQELEQLRQLSSFTMKRNKAFLTDKKRVFTILIILVLFYVCFLPEFVSLHVLSLEQSCIKSLTCRQMENVSSRLVLLNSALNPFVYAWRVKKYRQALFDTFRKTFPTNIVSKRIKCSKTRHRDAVYYL